MTQEVRITVDANLYCRHADGFFIDEAKFEWKKRITDYIKANAFADHKFVDVKVDIIPHDNDRDYTEEDAEKHLNGEKRKTYAEDLFEKFPNAGRSHCDGTPRVCRDSLYGSFGTCDERRCSDCWNAPMPDESEDADA